MAQVLFLAYQEASGRLLEDMNHRYLDAIDRAVLLARRAAHGGHLAEPERLTRFLYHQWYLGRSAGPQVPAPPRQRTAGPWRAWSPAWDEGLTRRGGDLVRLFLSCAPHTTLHAVSVVTQHAREWDAPWLLTSRSLELAVPRPNATVLHLPASTVEALRAPIEAMLEDLEPFLASSVPALTLRVGRGAALAQSPADGRTFGEHRCALIARSVLTHREHRHEVQLKATFEAFRGADVDPFRPYRSLDASWEWAGQTVAA